ncbi:14344_t:CDS:2, partial [Funneliformis geosporum]
GDGKVEAKILVRELYNDIKQDLSSKNNENLFSNPSLLDDSDIFKALEDDVVQEDKGKEDEEDEEDDIWMDENEDKGEGEEGFKRNSGNDNIN